MCLVDGLHDKSADGSEALESHSEVLTVHHAVRAGGDQGRAGHLGLWRDGEH